MRALALLPVAMVALAWGSTSCSTGVQADVGVDAYMQVRGARFVRGPLPSGAASGPAVTQLSLLNNNIWPGLTDDGVGGSLAPGATAAAIGLQGDEGYWLVVAGPPNVALPDDPTFSGALHFSNGIVPGNYTLVVQAADESGNFGPPTTQLLVAEASPTNPPPTGDLVVTLTWDRDVNLDLHVVQPDGFELYWNQPSSAAETDGGLPSPIGQADGGSYGFIDGNSNANCVLDGLNREDAIWTNSPPSGTYTVRVDTGSLCGQPIAYWQVSVVLQGQTIGQASGVAVDANTRGTHGAGAGVFALQFQVP